MPDVKLIRERPDFVPGTRTRSPGRLDESDMECGGKRSATPLWLRVTLADESGDLSCLRKRRRASLAAALQSDFVIGPDFVRQRLATRGAGAEARIDEVLKFTERRHKFLGEVEALKRICS